MPARLLDKALTPTEDEVRAARELLKKLDRLQDQGSVSLELVARARDEVRLRLSEIVVRLLAEALEQIAAGRSVGVGSLDEELSTQQAADLLNVSRPFLIGLLEQGRIRFRKVGTHRRIRLADLLEYKRARDAEAERAYRELVAEGQKLGLGYD